MEIGPFVSGEVLVASDSIYGGKETGIYEKAWKISDIYGRTTEMDLREFVRMPQYRYIIKEESHD